MWPDALGEKRGVALDPIHPSIPKALRENPDPTFYELLVLVDAIRSGRPRERDLAATLLRKHCSIKSSNDVNTANHYAPQD